MEKRLINIYINALYKTAKGVEHVEKITEALRVFDGILQNIRGFRSVLISRSVSPEKKMELIKSFESGFPAEVVNLFYLIIKKSRYSIFPDLLPAWADKLKKIYNIRKTSIITPFEADDKMKMQIDQYLKKIDPEGAHIKTYSADAGIIGGFKIIIGNIIYDNSFEGKIRSIREKML